jgi:hypothetical protein
MKQKAGQNCNLLIIDEAFENVEKSKYLEEQLQAKTEFTKKLRAN